MYAAKSAKDVYLFSQILIVLKSMSDGVTGVSTGLSWLATSASERLFTSLKVVSSSGSRNSCVDSVAFPPLIAVYIVGAIAF